MHPSPKFELDRLQLRLHPYAHRPPQHREAALPGRRAAMRESQEVKAVGLPLIARSPVRRRVAPEFEESRFVGMQRQTEPREPVAQVGEKPLGVVSMLESHDKIIGKPDDDHIALRLPVTPSVSPEVEDVVQVDIGQKRTHTAALHRTRPHS